MSGENERYARAMKGRHWCDLDTPCVVVDLDTMEHNIETMAQFLRANGKHCRPHFKAHMCIGIAQKQMAAGAIGLCAAKVSAAEVLADHGVSDILLANQIATADKLERLTALSKRCDVKVLADTLENVALLDAAAARAGARLGVLVEVRARSADSTFARGYTRNGCDTAADALRVARAIDAAPSLRLKGVMAYEGPHPKIRDQAARREAILRDP